MAGLLVLFALAAMPQVAHAQAPEIDVQANGLSIADEDDTPTDADHTDFGFARVWGGEVSRTFEIHNTGDASLSLPGDAPVTVSGTGAADFAVTQPFTATVSAGRVVGFMVKFDPSATGTRSATLSIANDDSDENPYNFDIQGTGMAGPSRIEALVSNIGQASTDRVGVGGTTRAQGFTTGGNAAGYTLTSIELDIEEIVARRPNLIEVRILSAGNDGTPVFLPLSKKLTNPALPQGEGVGVRTFAALPAPDDPEDPTDQAGLLLDANTRYFLHIASSLGSTGNSLYFKAAATGEDEGAASGWGIADAGSSKRQGRAWSSNAGTTLKIRVNGGANTTSAMSGPEIDVQGNGVRIADDDGTPTDIDHTDFGTAAANGKVARTFTIRNEGNAALTLTGATPATLGGTNAADFTVTAQPSSPVAANDTTTFTVEFDPLGPLERTATLSIASDDADENPYNFDIRGAAPQPTVTVAADAATVTEGSPAAFTVTASLAPLADLEVNLNVAATGEFGYGANTGSQTLTIASGQTTAAYTLTTTGDDIDETDGTVTVTVAAGTGYKVGINKSASVTVEDNDANSPAAGKPTISGTAQAGRTLSADVSAITDADGLSDPGWAYQWIRVDGSGTEADIANAINSTYVAASGDVGGTLKVQVGFADDAGNAESLTSDATATVAAEATAPGTGPIWTATLTVGESSGADPKLGFGSGFGGLSPRRLASGGRTIEVGGLYVQGSQLHVDVSVVSGAAVSGDLKLCLGGVAAAWAGPFAGAGGGDISGQGVAGIDWAPGQAVAVGVVASGGACAFSRIAGTVRYALSFEGKWTTAATPGGVPAGAHFSPLIGGVHNDGVAFWASGAMASAGIESMAEVGGTATLKSEVTAAVGAQTAASAIEGSGNGSPTGTETLVVDVHAGHPLVTLTTMIAPSPDWFVGVAGESLLDGNGAWRDSHAVDLFPYDAGTEDGTEFSLSNAASSPQGVITSLRGSGKFSSSRIAALSFERQPNVSVSPGAPSVAEGDDAVFTVTASRAAPTGGLAVALTVADAPDGDFVAAADEGAKRATIPAGSASVDYRVATADDGAEEDNGPVTVTLADGDGYRVDGPASASVTVRDDDAADPTPTVAIARGASPVTEGAAAVFTFTASPAAPSGGLAVALTVADAPGGNFVASSDEGSRTVTIAAGQTSADHRVPTVDDSTDEPSGDVTVTLAAGAGYGLGQPSSAAVRVNDNDDPPPPPGCPSGQHEHGGRGCHPINQDHNPPPPPGGGGGGGGGGSGNRGPVTVLVSDAVAREGEPLRFNVVLEGEGAGDLSFRGLVHPGTAAEGEDFVKPRQPFLVSPRFGSAAGAFMEVATMEDDVLEGDETVWLALSPERGSGGRDITFDPPLAKGTLLDADAPRARVPFVPAAGGAEGWQGFVRVVNGGEAAARAEVAAVDGAGIEAGRFRIDLGAGAALSFNSDDLEGGSAGKGIEGVGPPSAGHWRLDVRSEGEIEALGYMRVRGPGSPVEGFVTSLHDIVPEAPPDPPGGGGARYLAPFLNPGGNRRQESLLRLANPGAADAAVEVRGIDDAGAPGAGAARLVVPGGAALALTAARLESGEGLDGALGDGAGKWRLEVRSDRPLLVQSLMATPEGLLSNLSAAPPAPQPGRDGVRTWRAPLFPSASDPSGRQGFVRVVNLSDEAGELTVEADDESSRDYEPITLTVAPGATAAFNSNDLELGNGAKGISSGTGSGEGDWRLTLKGDFEFLPRAYLRTGGGFLTGMHGLLAGAPDGGGHAYRAPMFNPASNDRQVSSLLLLNDGALPAQVSVAGRDDRGMASEGEVRLRVPAGGSRTVTAQQLERGAPGLSGSLGDGAGKWRLTVTSDRPIRALSLLESPTGHLANLSAGARPGEGDESR